MRKYLSLVCEQSLVGCTLRIGKENEVVGGSPIFEHLSANLCAERQKTTALSSAVLEKKSVMLVSTLSSESSQCYVRHPTGDRVKHLLG